MGTRSVTGRPLAARSPLRTPSAPTQPGERRGPFKEAGRGFRRSPGGAVHVGNQRRPVAWIPSAPGRRSARRELESRGPDLRPPHRAGVPGAEDKDSRGAAGPGREVVGAGEKLVSAGENGPQDGNTVEAEGTRRLCDGSGLGPAASAFWVQPGDWGPRVGVNSARGICRRHDTAR